MMKIEVKGHSGCRIDVVNSGNNIYVYKSTADTKYLKRLVLQAEKQKAAAEVEYQHIRVPKIFDIEKNDASVVVKMQYVYSKNFIEFFEQAGFEQIDYLIGALEQFIEYEINRCKLQQVSAQIFRDKFADIRAKCEANSLYQGDAAIEQILTRADRVFTDLNDLLIPVGLCHGDLTFSNILFNGNNYYLIDFLDSFVETPLQDIVKIRQDTAHHWSQLMYTKRYDAVRLRIVLDKIDREIDSYFHNKYQWYHDYYRVMQLMNILRILPYAHEAKVIDYLKATLTEILDKFANKNDELTDNSQSTNAYRLSEEEAFCDSRSLIMPIAVDKPEYESRIPQVFLISDEGVMHCIRAIKSLDFNSFDHIYISILRHLDERYSLTERLLLQLRINGIKNAEIVVLDEPTRSQPETIYQTIKKKRIQGFIFIKDADCSFTGESTSGNAITIHPLEQLNWVNPKNKSYVSVDDMYYITNIIEKRIVSHYFTAGGYSFASATTYCQYYERLQHHKDLYLSHIIYSMLLEGHTFRPMLASKYEDFEFHF